MDRDAPDRRIGLKRDPLYLETVRGVGRLREKPAPEDEAHFLHELRPRRAGRRPPERPEALEGEPDLRERSRYRHRVFRSISDEGIQARRSATAVPVGKGETIHDYVPLFFGARPPMLYAVKFKVSQEDIVTLLVNWSVLDLATTVFTEKPKNVIIHDVARDKTRECVP